MSVVIFYPVIDEKTDFRYHCSLIYGPPDPQYCHLLISTFKVNVIEFNDFRKKYSDSNKQS